MSKTVESYVQSLESASVLARHFAPGNIYHGQNGAMRLAREVGYGLAGFPEPDVDEIIGSLYSRLLVRFTFSSSGGVPVAAKPWLVEMRAAMDKVRKTRPTERLSVTTNSQPT